MRKFVSILFKTFQTIIVAPFCLALGAALAVGVTLLAIFGLPVYITGIVTEDIWEINDGDI